MVTSPFRRGCGPASPAVFPSGHSPYPWRPVLLNAQKRRVRNGEVDMRRPDRARVTLRNPAPKFGEQGNLRSVRGERLLFYGSFSFTDGDAVYLCGQQPSASANAEYRHSDAQNMRLPIRRVNQRVSGPAHERFY